jgi:hypothetical protein
MPQVDRLDRLEALLQQVWLLEPQSRNRPLATLAQQMVRLRAEQPGRFDAVLERSRQGPPEHRAELLAAFLHEMDVLPRQRRLALFNVIFDQIAELEPDHLAMPLARLASNLRGLDHNERVATFDRAFRTIEQLPNVRRSPWLTEFTLQIYILPPSARMAAFDRAFAMSGQLPVPDQPQHLFALAVQVDLIPGANHRASRLRAVLEAAGRLPPSHRLPLAEELRTVPGFYAPDLARDDDADMRLLRELQGMQTRN